MRNEQQNPEFFNRMAESRLDKVGLERVQQSAGQALDRTFLTELADRQLALLKQGRPDEAPTYIEIDGREYIDPAIFAQEQRAIFSRYPVVAGLSQDIAGPGDYLLLEHTAVPILVTRNENGAVKAFVNACRHRGAALVYEGRGSAGLRLSCPYHAWTYNLNGELIGQPCQEAFAGLDKTQYGLIELPCEELHGIIFVSPSPDQPLDLDRHIDPQLQRELAYWGFDKLSAARSAPIPLEGNWKLVFDTFFESYHFNYAHKNNLAHFYNGNINTVDEIGRHLRISVSLKSIADELQQQPPAERIPENYVHVSYLLFPGMILINTPQVLEMFRLFPISVDKTVVEHSCYSRMPLDVPSNAEMFDTIWNTAHHIVMSEDFPYGVTTAHRALKSGALKKLVFGKNELPGHLMHATIRASIA
jgi:phenylpropionate dioxygenase-like ring-hydroxylating dioxygenase large terminal subunit